MLRAAASFRHSHATVLLIENGACNQELRSSVCSSSQHALHVPPDIIAIIRISALMKSST